MNREEEYEEKVVLVTGGAGAIGINLMERWRSLLLQLLS